MEGQAIKTNVEERIEDGDDVEEDGNDEEGIAQIAESIKVDHLPKRREWFTGSPRSDGDGRDSVTKEHNECDNAHRPA